ncbi:MAG: S8 family serine peptidase [Acidobacteria bacterium]|nr:S8 family serine peptidase [Acidobacteriota bacterium]
MRTSFSIANAVSVQAPNAAVLARLQNDPRVAGVYTNHSIFLDAPQGQAGSSGKGGGGGSSGGSGKAGGKPSAPSGLTAVATSPTSIDLTWNDNSSNEDGFRIERCTGTGCSNFSQIDQVAPGVSSYGDLGLAASTTYRYRVLAFNATGNSKYSNTAEATTDPQPVIPPAAPSDLTLPSITYNQINLAWTDNSTNEDGFRIERCMGTMTSCTDPGFLQIGEVGPDVNTYNSNGLAAETTYTFRARAFNAAGNSSYSNPTEGTTAPAPPTNQVVPAGVERIGAAPGRTSKTGAGVGVAVVDTGLDFAHQDLGLDPEVIGVNSFNASGGSCQDIHGHGTHVAGIIAARDNLIDVVGVAPNATVYCVNVFQPDPVYDVVATDESLIAGLQWIYDHANQVDPPIRVINMSLGRPLTPQDTPDHPLHLAVQSLYDSGISVVVSAGNEVSVEVSDMVPASYAEVMAVASSSAVDGYNGYDDVFTACPGEHAILADTASYFSTDGAFLGGTGVTVSAPGEEREDIFDYLGTCFVESIGVLSTWPGNATIELSGTSMAAPLVTGVVALMWEKELDLGLNLSPETARTRIRSSVDRFGTAPLESEVTGYTYDGEKEGILWAPAAVGDETPPPPDLPPTLSITSPTDGATFEAGASISFTGSASDPEDGPLSNAIVWTSSIDGQIGVGGSFSLILSGGIHTITATITDSGGNVESAAVSITVGNPTTPTSVHVASVNYSMLGTSLLTTVELDDEFAGPVAGANIIVFLDEWLWGSGHWEMGGTTNSQGKVQFQLVNAPWGCYLARVMSIDAGGLTWDGTSPDNWFCN